MILEVATLLGAPLFPGPVLNQAWADRCDNLSRAVKKLSQLDSHRDESVPKNIINNTINLFLHCNQHFGNFKP